MDVGDVEREMMIGGQDRIPTETKSGIARAVLYNGNPHWDRAPPRPESHRLVVDAPLAIASSDSLGMILLRQSLSFLAVKHMGRELFGRRRVWACRDPSLGLVNLTEFSDQDLSVTRILAGHPE
jgi:hypothetical protein